MPPHFGALMPKAVIERIAANDSGVTKVDLSNNATFQMKTLEYCTSLATAMTGNTYVKEIVLAKCNITDQDVKALSPMLCSNKGLEKLSLEGNKIGSDGVIALAEALLENETLTDLTLLGQEKGIGEPCLEAWMKTLEENTHLLNISWRLESRKSFRLNQFLTRNKEIARRRRDGREFESLLPGARRPSQGGEANSPDNGEQKETGVDGFENGKPKEAVQEPPAATPEASPVCESVQPSPTANGPEAAPTIQQSPEASVKAEASTISEPSPPAPEAEAA